MNNKQKNTILHEELEKLQLENGALLPGDVVKAATSVDSPLHSFFEWNNSKAAHAYRLWQARELINTVTVEIQGRKVEAYHSVRVVVDDRPKRAYFPTKTIIKSKTMRESIIQDAIAEIEYWQKKYDDISQLEPIVNKKAIERVKRTLP